MEDAKPRPRRAKELHAYVATAFGRADGIESCTEKDVVLACGPTNRNDLDSEVDEVQPDTVIEIPSNATSTTKCTANAPLPLCSWEGGMKRCEGDETEQSAEDTGKGSMGIEHGSETEDGHEDEVAEYQLGEEQPQKSDDKNKEGQDEVCDEEVGKERQAGDHKEAEETTDSEMNAESEQHNDIANRAEIRTNDTNEREVSVIGIAKRMEEAPIGKRLEDGEAVIGRIAKHIIKLEPVPAYEKNQLAEALEVKNTSALRLVVEVSEVFRDLCHLGEILDKSVIGEFIAEERLRYGKYLTEDQMTLILETVAKEIRCLTELPFYISH